MMVRTQIALEAEDHRRAKRRAAEMNVSLAEYVRRIVHRDLGAGERPKADISAIFDLGHSGGSDIAKHKDEYIGEALWHEHLRKTGQQDRPPSSSGS
jgi:hypothetical protein